MIDRPGIPLDTETVSAVVLAGERLLLVEDPGGFWSHLSTRVGVDEKASAAALRAVSTHGSMRVEALYAAEYLERYFDLPSERIVLCPAFVAIVAAPDGASGRWCTLEEALERTPFPNQHALYRQVFEHFVSASPPDWLRVQLPGGSP